MTTKPRYSIVVPTRNRAHLLAGVISTALAVDYDDYEVLVSLNHCTDDSEAILEAIDDERLRYVKTSRSLPMPDHWDFALAQARGDFVTVLCDDDAILPDALKRADAIFEANPTADGLVFGLAVYIHPDTLPGHPPNTLCVLTPSDVVRRGGQEEELACMASGGAVRNVPKMLNSIVSSRAIETIRRNMGRCFPPSCPDYSFAAGFMMADLEFVVTDRVYALWGLSHSSIGMSASTGQNSSCGSFVEEFEEDPIPHSRVKGDLIPAHVSSTVLTSAELCGIELPFDVNQYYLSLFQACEYRERTTGFNPARAAVWAGLDTEPPESRASILRHLRENGVRGLTSLDRLSYWIQCRMQSLRNRARILAHRSPWLHALKERLRPVPHVVQANGDRAVRGAEHGFTDVAEAAARYRGLEQQLFGEPSEPIRSPAGWAHRAVARRTSV